jgi:subtilisin family serine protease
MKLILTIIFIALVLSSCVLPGGIAPNTENILPPPTDVEKVSPLNTEIPASGPVKLYADVREKDLSVYGVSLGEPTILTLWFSKTTKWFGNDGSIAQRILEIGKNPGLGVRGLHSRGITGKGVTVAIIDQNMQTDHPEFFGKIVKYQDFGTNQGPNEGSMHGPAVTSLLVGETIGTAPGARVYYASVPSWLEDAQYYADALTWIISENALLPADQKIRVVSVSAAPSGQGTPFSKNNKAWDNAVTEAMAQGILILDCTDNKGITAPCHYNINDQENPGACVPGYAGVEKLPNTNRIFIPSSYRTTAEEYYKGDYGFQYDGQGGLSWTTPYLAGVLAMGWQLRPDMTGDELLKIIYDTSYKWDENIKIINPPAFIDSVEAAK